MSSKKMLSTIIIMAILVILSIGGYLLVDTSKRKQEDADLAERNSLQLFSFSSDNVNAVGIQTDEGSFRIENVSGTWTLTETDYPYDFILNTYYINSVCAYMSTLTALQKLSIAPERLDAYGLTDPVTVTCYEGSTAHTLYIGDASATEEYYYVMVPDDNTVYGIDYDAGTALHAGTAYLKSPYMIPYNDVHITAISLAHGKDVAYDLERVDGMWHMKEPLPDANVDSAQVSAMLTAIARMEINSFVTVAESKADLSAYGLDKPDHTLTVTAGEDTTVLQFADNPENDSEVYMLNEASGQIAIMGSGGFLNTQPIELLKSTLLSLTFYDISAMEATGDDLEFTMTINHEAKQYLLNDTDVSELGETAVTAYQSLFQSIAMLKYDAVDADAKIPEEPEIVYEFRFTLTDGTETVLTLIQADEPNHCWALIDGTYTYLTVPKSSLTNNAGMMGIYEKLMDMIEEN